MRALRRVAAAGVAVVVSIHQPPADVFFACAAVVLLAPGGWLAYAGPVGRRGALAVAHFEALPRARLRCPTGDGANVATWLLAVTAAAGDGGGGGGAGDAGDAGAGAEAAAGGARAAPPPSPPGLDPAAAAAAGGGGGLVTAAAIGSPPWLAAAFDASAAGAANRAIVDALTRAPAGAGAAGAGAGVDAEPAGGAARALVRPLRALAVVCARAHRDHWRSAEYQTTRLLVTLFQAVVLGLLFMDVQFATFAGTLSALGLFLVAPAYISILYLSASVTFRFERREVLYRELAAGFYAPESWALAALSGDVPYAVVTVLAASAIVYFIVGLRPSAAAFFFFALATLVLALFYMTLGVALAAVMPTLPIAQLVGGLCISITFLFAGLFLPARSLPPFWQGLYYAVPTSHVLRAISLDQLCACEGAACPLISVVTPSGALVLQTQCAFVEEFLGATASQRWVELGWAALAVAVVAAVAVLGTRFCVWQRR
jgi:hypothetical protein